MLDNRFRMEHLGGLRYCVSTDAGLRLTQQMVVSLLAEPTKGLWLRECFRAWFARLERANYVWECKPVLREAWGTVHFEFAIVWTPQGEVMKDTTPYRATHAGRFQTATRLGGLGRAVIWNKSRGTRQTSMSHLFDDSNSEDGRELFLHVGRAVLESLNQDPVWISSKNSTIPWVYVKIATESRGIVTSDYVDVVKNL